MARFTGIKPRLFMGLLAALALALALPLSASAAFLVQISADPFTNPTSQHQTELEPDTFAVGSRLVSAFQVGRFYDGGASDIGFATSSDNGNTWVSGFLPGTTVFAPSAGTYQRVSDPSVAYDAKHGVWIISYLGIIDPLNGPVDVLVSRSTDGGLTWGMPVVVNSSGHFNDKNWTACDNTSTSPFYGNCYTEYDDNSLGNLLQMTTSSDGGLTWGAPLTPASYIHGIGGQPVVQPTGNVVVPVIGFSGNQPFLLSFTSGNGGASWTKPVIVARMAFHNPAGGIRANIPMPSAEVDAAGTVYVVWSDCRFESGCHASDLVFSTTQDGRKWTKITRIPLDPVKSGVDHFLPGLAVDRSTSGASAHLAVTYYYYPNANCTTDTCQLNVGYSVSPDGGASWTAGAQLAGPMSLTQLPATSQGYMVGDYISGSFVSSGSAVPVFSVAHPASGAAFDEASYTVMGGLAVTGPFIPATNKANVGASATLTTSFVTQR